MCRYHAHGVLDVVLTLASSIEDERASKLPIDHVVLEILYLLFLRTTPDAVAVAATEPTAAAAQVPRPAQRSVHSCACPATTDQSAPFIRRPRSCAVRLCRSAGSKRWRPSARCK